MKFPSFTPSRRHLLKNLSLGAGSVLLPPLVNRIRAESAGLAPPKRFVFVLQNNGFQPWGAQPVGLEYSDGGPAKAVDRDLAPLELPDDLSPLSEIKHRVTILQRLNGAHCRPFHSGGFSALSGSREARREPLTETIDAALGKAAPGVFPVIGLGLNAEDHNNTDTAYVCSAWGAKQPIPTRCNPDGAYRTLFGSVAEGEAAKDFSARAKLLDFMKDDVRRVTGRLAPGSEREKLAVYLSAYENMSGRQTRLAAMAEKLRKVAPSHDDRYQSTDETERLEAQFELAAAALIGQLTNVVTICSGLCSPNGQFRGLGINIGNHSIGHRESDGDLDYRALYTIIRKHHIGLIAGLVRRLEAIPEGDGTMMDNTLILYTSDTAYTHHSDGKQWPFVLVGNAGGNIRSGRFLEYPAYGAEGNRTINALYCTLLHAAGFPREHFNLDGALAAVDRKGPLEELLA